MFPEAQSSGMMVITVTQRTQNNMMSWCADVEQEREQMLERVSCCFFTLPINRYKTTGGRRTGDTVNSG